MAKRTAKTARADVFSVAEQTFSMELYQDYRDVIVKKGNTAVINKAMEVAWQTIADRLNA